LIDFFVSMSIHQRLAAGFTFLAFLCGAACTSGKRAELREAREIIRTYPFGGPDPVPIMTRSGMWGNGARLYPYTFIDEFSREAVDRDWTVVRLENPFIEVSVLPEVGGKIWGALEKSTGREFIYTNHALKFREIALRGPWTSGGIEFNFGIVGHTPSGAHPVDYILQKLPDGGVRCVVGNLDLPSRTRWSIAVTVPPDRAYFETRAMWTNPTPLHQSYYAWMNGAVRTSPDMQYTFPGRFHIAHDFSAPLRPWPVDEAGRDLSWYRNNDFGSYKSYFTIGEYAEYFGSYWHQDRFGFGHWARYDDMPGHKAWIWGLSRQGMIWEDLLTDFDGQYTEPQAGRYLNQNDHELFAPYTNDRWREIWFPYTEIGPMDSADPTGVLHVDIETDAIIVSICPLQYLHGDLVVRQEDPGKEIHRERLRMKPLKVIKKRIPVPSIPRRFTVRVGPGLVFDSDPRADDLTRPLRFHPYGVDSTEGLFLKAGRLERERSYSRALEGYSQVMERDPRHIRAMCRAAEILHRRGEDDRAIKIISRALDIAMYDPEANHVYAMIARSRGDLVNALETLGWASRSMAFRSGAFCRMGEIHLTRGRPEAALEYAAKSLEYDGRGLPAMFLEAAALRRLGRDEAAEKTLIHILEIDPLHHGARHLLSLLEKSLSAEKAFVSHIRNEYPQETFLEIALTYERLGMRAEALDVLNRAPRHPVILYWTAYLLRDANPESSARELGEAGKMSARMVFPFRTESIPVFRWAADQLPKDWKPAYYLGLIYWGKERLDDAWRHFEACGNPEFAPLHMIRAYFLSETDPEGAQSEFEAAVRLEPDEWRYRHRMLDFLNTRAQADDALKAAREAGARFPDNISLQVEMVRALMHNRDFTAAARILDELDALPSEGATAVHQLYVDCHLMRGGEAVRKGELEKAVQAFQTSRLYPERLGTGAPYDPDHRLADYLTALCYIRMGRETDARDMFEAVRDYTLRHWPEEKIHPYIGGLSLRGTDQEEKARKLLKSSPPEQEMLEIIDMLDGRKR